MPTNVNLKVNLNSTDPDQYFDLGGHTRAVTTSSDSAQYWFNHGLNWCFGFNQEEGLVCFQKALEFDSECAMAHWGIAYAAGPFYNLPWCDFGESEKVECTRYCSNHAQQALSLIEKVTEPEKRLIEALSFRFQADHPISQQAFDQWDDDYADAMRKAFMQFPDDQDIAALFVEAMMTRTPWKLWDVKRAVPAANADTVECLEVLERAIDESNSNKQPQHPAILHLHIHCLEMSSEPERAITASNILGALCPDAGHMNHMPGHIYVLCGMYEEAKAASIKAIRADRMYRDYAGDDNFYTTARCHDLHLMMYACMFLGQFTPAMEAADEMRDFLTADLLDVPNRPQMAATLEGYYSMRMHVLVRFGRWQDIIDEKFPSDSGLFLASIPMWHYAKGIAHASLGQFDKADQHQRHFLAAKKKVPDNRKIFNNLVMDILGIANEMLSGEIEYHKGNFDVAFQHLRLSVDLCDGLAYSEPWAWMHPPRHALGALLLEQNQVEEAEQVYRADLGLSDTLYRCAQNPGNVWSLHGLSEILNRTDKKEEYLQISEQLKRAKKLADQTISSSCCCRKNIIEDE